MPFFREGRHCLQTSSESKLVFIGMKHGAMLTHRKCTYAPEAQSNENLCEIVKLQVFNFFEKSKNFNFETILVTYNSFIWELRRILCPGINFVKIRT